MWVGGVLYYLVFVIYFGDQFVYCLQVVVVEVGVVFFIQLGFEGVQFVCGFFGYYFVQGEVVVYMVEVLILLGGLVGQFFQSGWVDFLVWCVDYVQEGVVVVWVDQQVQVVYQVFDFVSGEKVGVVGYFVGDLQCLQFYFQDL